MVIKNKLYGRIVPKKSKERRCKHRLEIGNVTAKRQQVCN